MPNDALTAARFELSIDGHSMAVFSELAGITTEVETVDYVPSGEHESVFLNRFAAVRKPIKVRLRRARSNNMDMWTWHEAATLNPRRPPKKVHLHLYEGPEKPPARYCLENAWPSKIEIGGLRAGGTASAMETVTMTCEFIQRVSV
jgi:phage tail-like protein